MAYIEGLPRVSAIVSSVYPFEGEDEKRFHSWLKSKNIDVEEYMNVANDAGTAIHKAIEEHILGEYLGSDYPLYVKRGVDFLKEHTVTPIYTEHYIRVDNKYQGTIDLIGEIDGELWVLDWKTYGIAQEILGTKSSSYKYKKPYSKLKKASLQLSLYAMAMGIENIGVVELASDGYHFHKLKRIPDEELNNIVLTQNIANEENSK